jgi:lipopolysaccharide/colanic/teichoic acid biosynthesis glycosyltransferase
MRLLDKASVIFSGAACRELPSCWQINGRADKPMYLNTADDLFYIRNYSFWLDMQIIVRTLLTVITGRGAF